MPELPEVETVRRGLQPAMEAAQITTLELRRPDLRFPFADGFSEMLAGRRIQTLARRAKYLLINLDDGGVVIAHLGMSGSFRIEMDEDVAIPGLFHHPRSQAIKHDHVLFHLMHASGQPLRVIYNDPRRFGFMLYTREGDLPAHPLLSGLGMEPTGNRLDGEAVAQLFSGKGTTLKAALLDQRLIAGLGNIYVSEALWRARLSPFRAAGSVSTEESAVLASAIRSVIAEAIEAGGSSLKDHRQADGSLGYFQHRFSVYDRTGENCRTPGCAGSVERAVQNGRSTFYCRICQS